jgi:hypothetical protein
MMASGFPEMKKSSASGRMQREGHGLSIISRWAAASMSTQLTTSSGSLRCDDGPWIAMLAGGGTSFWVGIPVGTKTTSSKGQSCAALAGRDKDAHVMYGVEVPPIYAIFGRCRALRNHVVGASDRSWCPLT